MTQVPLLNLQLQYRSIKEEVDAAIARVVNSQYFIMGPEVEGLEKEIAEYCQCDYAVGVSSGTDAILVALIALGVSPGDEIITTPFTFFASVGSILRLGAKPVFADIDRATFNIDPERVKAAITPRTKAIMPVHLFGQCADMDPLLRISEEKGIPLVEDAAQAIGSEYKGRRAGSIGTVGCFSFFPSKNLGAFGDAGMITTNDGKLAEKMAILRNQGAKVKNFHTHLGGNFRLDALQAAVLRVKLKHLETWSEKRRENAAYFTLRLNEMGIAGKGIAPPAIVHERHIFNQYVPRAENRDALKDYLETNGIGAEIYYPLPMHLQKCVNDGKYAMGNFPEAEEACRSVLALPIFPELTEIQKEYVVSKIGAFYRA